MEDKIKQANPTLHRYLFTVTTFSKLLAMTLFIVLPLIVGWRKVGANTK